jgi:hypothetical protein
LLATAATAAVVGHYKVLERPGQAMGEPDFVAPHAPAVCDEVGERTPC